MSRFRWSLLLAVSAQAAAIRGVVLDHASGRPLARSVVTLQAVQGYGGGKTSVRTGSSGQFVFSPLSAGAYLLSASRPGFAGIRYGQKYWNAPGAPILVAEDSAPFLDLRLRRLGSIAGVVWDENEIGIPEQEVFAYWNTRPPTLVSRSRTDDRGGYHIWGLEPGQYLIRTGPKDLDEEISVVPTFYKDSTAAPDARTIDVELDEQAADINVRPAFGKLFKLTGSVYGVPLPGTGAVTLSLLSDMGQIPGNMNSSGQFTFDHLAPGDYELVADASQSRPPMGAYRRFFMERDTTFPLPVGPNPTVRLVIQEKEGKPVDPRAVSVLARRKDISGEGYTQRLKDGTALLAGRWEIAVAPVGDFYPVAISMHGGESMQPARADSWNEFLVGSRPRVDLEVTLAAGASRLRGRVTQSTNAPAVGSPVYLEAFDSSAGKRIAELRKTLTDARGEYRFVALTPGEYRVVSSFEFEDPDERTMEAARALLVLLKAGTESVRDLDLYTRP